MPSLPPGPIVVDASVIVAVAQGEKRSKRFEKELSRALMPSVTFGEVLYVLHRVAKTDPATVEATFTGMGMQITPIDLPAVRKFPLLKTIDSASRDAQVKAGTPQGSLKSLSLGDIVCLAYAWEHSLPVLTGDRHWTTLRPHGYPNPVFDFRDPKVTP